MQWLANIIMNLIKADGNLNGNSKSAIGIEIGPLESELLNENDEIKRDVMTSVIKFH